MKPGNPGFVAFEFFLHSSNFSDTFALTHTDREFSEIPNS